MMWLMSPAHIDIWYENNAAADHELTSKTGDAILAHRGPAPSPWTGAGR